MKKFIHLPGAGETGFIEDVEMFLAIVRLVASRQMALTRSWPRSQQFLIDERRERLGQALGL